MSFATSSHLPALSSLSHLHPLHPLSPSPSASLPTSASTSTRLLTHLPQGSSLSPPLSQTSSPMNASARIKRQASYLDSVRDSDKNTLNMTILLGNPGTGKSTAADYFKQGAQKRNLNTVYVQTSEADTNVSYAVLRKILWTLLDPYGEYECGDNTKKIILVDEILAQLTEHSSKLLSKECSQFSPKKALESSSLESTPERSSGSTQNFRKKFQEFSTKSNSERSSQRSVENSPRIVLLRILGLECSARSSSMLSCEEPHVTVLDRRMSRTSAAPKGTYVCVCVYLHLRLRVFLFSFL